MGCACPEWTEMSGTPVGICGMQSLQFPAPLPSTLSSPLFFEDLGMAHKGRKSLRWLQQICCSTEPHFRIRALSPCTALLGPTVAQPPASQAWAPIPPARPFPAPAPRMSGTGAGNSSRGLAEWVWCCQCSCPHLTWPTGRAQGREQGRWAHSKLLFPARAKPLPLGWLVSRLCWLWVNVKPFVGLPKGREFEGAGRKEWQRLDGIFLGLLHIPRIPLPARRPSRDLEESLVYCCPFQLNFLPLSILDKGCMLWQLSG